MKTLFRACAVCTLLVRFRPCRRGGDPLFRTDRPFSDLHRLRLPIRFCSEVRGIAQPIFLNDPETPISLRQRNSGALAARRLVALRQPRAATKGRPHVARRPFPVESRSRELYLTYDTDNRYLSRTEDPPMGDGRRHQPHGSHQSAGYAGPGHDRACRQPAPVWLFSGTVSGNEISFEGVPSQGRGQRPAPLRQPVGTARPARTPAAAGRRPLHDHGSRRTGQMVPGCGIRRAPLLHNLGGGIWRSWPSTVLSTTRCS